MAGQSIKFIVVQRATKSSTIERPGPPTHRSCKIQVHCNCAARTSEYPASTPPRVLHSTPGPPLRFVYNKLIRKGGGSHKGPLIQMRFSLSQIMRQDFFWVVFSEPKDTAPSDKQSLSPSLTTGPSSYPIKSGGRRGHPLHALSALLCARRQQAKPLTRRRVSLWQRVSPVRSSQPNSYRSSFPLLFGVMCL